MTYDFETIMDRRGNDALAVDAIGAGVDWAVVPTKPKNGFSAIPMWVADMRFATVPTIPQAIIKRAEHPAYGYYLPTDEYFDSIIRLHKERNRVGCLERKNIGYENDAELHTNEEIDSFAWFSFDEARKNIRPNSLAAYFLNTYLDEWN